MSLAGALALTILILAYQTLALGYEVSKLSQAESLRQLGEKLTAEGKNIREASSVALRWFGVDAEDVARREPPKIITVWEDGDSLFISWLVEHPLNVGYQAVRLRVRFRGDTASSFSISYEERVM